ncbi:N-alpha-acetyltransferase 60 isoform X1 [Anopheles nili]|uniref:N-alpha-acetyltransferase 60 isoform X1 n=1 Tax=Anopheles nili TaxID=185578 RepID=UPI00237B5D3C|nr:N-alpha-acetyltransferase 60 isoform X1 [Anopheles nili]
MAQSFTWFPVNHLGSTKSNERLQTPYEYPSVPLCSANDVQLRFLCPDDLEEVRTLCQDWFPIDYPLSWYVDITSSTRFFALAAIYNFSIIGLIVAEIKSYSKLNKECTFFFSQDRGILPESMGREAEIGYILSLGVHRKYRQNGIGSLLLDSLINHLTTAERHKVKAIFLHVLTTNRTAILFYERRGFVLHSFLPYYYSIRGKCKDGFTYVSYINGGHSPWSLYDYLKYWCSQILTAGGLCPWICGRMRTALRWVCYRTVGRFHLQQDE